MSIAIVFGLAFSKLITLGLVPALLALPYRVREARATRRARREGRVPAALPAAVEVRRRPGEPEPQAAE